MNVSILEFGASANSNILQNEFIQRAIDHCHFNGGGEVLIPSGEFLISGIRLRSNVTLRLLSGAKLIGSRNIDDYRILFDEDAIEPLPQQILPEVRTKDEQATRAFHRAMIHVYGATNVAIVGEQDSVIDGKYSFDPNGEEEFRGAHIISILKSKKITLQGYTAQHAGNSAHSIWACENLLCENITVFGGDAGIALYKVKQATIRHCKLFTGNDCFLGFNNYDVIIEDNELNTSCNCFRFAGTNVTIQRCNAYGPGIYGHRKTLPRQAQIDGEIATADRFPECRYNLIGFFIFFATKSLYVRKAPSNIVISDCTMHNLNRFFTFTYKNDPWQQNKPLADITFRNIKATELRIPIMIYGSEKAPVSVAFENCDLLYSENRRDNALIKVANCGEIKLMGINTNTRCETIIATYGNSVRNISTKGDYSEREFQIGSWSLEDFDTTFI